MGVDKDYTFDAQYVQDPLHKLNYRGKLFSFNYIVDSLASGNSEIVLLNARTEILTVELSWEVTATGHVNLFEVTSWAGGSVVNPMCHYLKYHDVNSISAILLSDPSSINVQVSSTPLWSQLVPAGSKNQASGGNDEVSEHLIIPPGRTIIVELTNQSGSGGSVGLGGVIHETPIDPLDEGI